MGGVQINQKCVECNDQHNLDLILAEIYTLLQSFMSQVFKENKTNKVPFKKIMLTQTNNFWQEKYICPINETSTSKYTNKYIKRTYALIKSKTKLKKHA